MARTPLNLTPDQPAEIRSFLNAVAFTNGKGGVGKTSITANIGGLLADADYKILIIDFDPQSNLNRDLGYDRDTGVTLFDALRAGEALPVTEGVRPNLDVVKGGPEMFGLATVLQGRGLSVAQALSQSLAPLAASYDFILFDTSPGEQDLVNAVLMVCSSVIIPTTSDDAAVDGVEMAAMRFAQAKKQNQTLSLAGVVLFRIGSQSRRIERVVRRELEDLLEEVAPVFRTRIRHMEGAALDARKRGLLVHELEPIAAKAQRERFAKLRAGEQESPSQHVHSSDVAGLAEDYANLAREILNRLIELQGGAQNV